MPAMLPVIRRAKYSDTVTVTVGASGYDLVVGSLDDHPDPVPPGGMRLYNAAAPMFRDVVFGWPGDGRQECKSVAVEGTQVRKEKRGGGTVGQSVRVFAQEDCLSVDLEDMVCDCVTLQRDVNWSHGGAGDLATGLAPRCL